MPDQPSSPSPPAVGAPADASTGVERLVSYDGPPEQFLSEMLRTQCITTGAAAAALIRPDEQGRPIIVAAWPVLQNPRDIPDWLAAGLRFFTQSPPLESAAILPLHRSDQMYGQQAQEHLLVQPMRSAGHMHAAAIYLLHTGEPNAIELARHQLAWTPALMSMYELKLTLHQRSAALSQLRLAQQMLAELNAHRRYQSAAMALCNELAGKFAAHRVSIGFLHRSSIKLATMSHTEKFTRQMRIVQDTEAAMEESLDQDLEVVFPVPDNSADAPAVVSRAAAELSRQHGPSAVVSLPMRYDGEPCAVLTVEREIDQPWTYAEIAVLRLTCELCTARLVELYDHDRWPGVKLMKSTRRGLAAMVGPTHTWIKLAAVAAIALVLFLIFAKGTYRVEAPFVIEAIGQRSIPAPFAGNLDGILVKPGDVVKAGRTVLGKMNTDTLELQLNAAESERRQYLGQADQAMRQDQQADRQIAQAQADAAQAKIDLLRYQLDHANITAPIDGVVVKSEYEHRSGSPVDKGAILFEIVPPDALRATLMVPEDRVSEILSNSPEKTADSAIGIKPLAGELAPASNPSHHLPIRLTSITPLAEVVDQRNVFRIRAQLTEADAQALLRPGMEGLAKIDVDRRRYAWIWTHDLVNWLRMKLWL